MYIEKTNRYSSNIYQRFQIMHVFWPTSALQFQYRIDKCACRNICKQRHISQIYDRKIDTYYTFGLTSMLTYGAAAAQSQKARQPYLWRRAVVERSSSSTPDTTRVIDPDLLRILRQDPEGYPPTEYLKAKIFVLHKKIKKTRYKFKNKKNVGRNYFRRSTYLLNILLYRYDI